MNAAAFFANRRLQVVVLFLVSFLLYANTLTHGFVLDDGIVITENKAVRAGFSGLKVLFTKDSFFGFSGSSEAAHIVAGARYRPLSLALFAVLYQFFGAQPFVFHLFTVLLYAGVVVLLYRTFALLLAPVWSEGTAAAAAFATALLFAVHPVHTEVVANVKSCDELLALGGGLLALFAALRAVDRRSGKWVFVAAAAFFAACLGKENAITFLAIIPLCIWWWRDRGQSRDFFVKTSGAIGAAGIAFLVLRHAVTGGFSGGNEAANALLNNPYVKQVNGQWVAFSAGERTATIFYALGKYLQLLVLPHPLTHDYYPKYIDRLTWANPLSLLSAALYMALAVFAVLGPRRFLAGRFAAAWYLLALSVVSNLAFPVGTHLNERFLFTPSVGFCFGAVALAGLWLRGVSANGKAAPGATPAGSRAGSRSGGAAGALVSAEGFVPPWPVLLLCGIVVAAFSLKTVMRNPVWANDERLVLTDVAVSARSARANDAAAGVLFNRSLRESKPEKKQELWRSALQYSETALDIYPDMPTAHANAAKCQHFLGRYDAAIAHYRAAIRLEPNRPEYRRNMAMSLRDGGQYYGEQRNDPVTARRYLAESWQISDQDPVTAWLTGVTWLVQGDAAQAADWYAKALALSPDNPTYLYDLGMALRRTGQEQKGMDLQRRALQLQPDLIETRK